MFTGIVEEVGKIRGVHTKDRAKQLVIECESVIKKAKVGDSVMVDGICLTIEEILESSFVVTVIEETLRKTVANKYCPEDYVNLESALKMGDPIGGHMVQGHVETVAFINSIVVDGGDVRLTVTIDSPWLRYCLPKGSIALDGVSLTIADLSTAGLTVALIPYTLSSTTLGRQQVGDPVNIETDILVRYVERLFEMDGDEDRYDLEIEKLRNWGYGES